MCWVIMVGPAMESLMMTMKLCNSLLCFCSVACLPSELHSVVKFLAYLSRMPLNHKRVMLRVHGNTFSCKVSVHYTTDVCVS